MDSIKPLRKSELKKDDPIVESGAYNVIHQAGITNSTISKHDSTFSCKAVEMTFHPSVNDL